MFNKAGKFSGSFVKVYTPSITSPTASQIVASRTPTLTASAFSKYGNITHASTDWQVSSSPDFSSIVWESLNNSSNKTSITTGDLGGGDRYVRVRYRANNGVVSEWSAAILFTSPWGSGSNATLVSSTVMDVNQSTTVTLQPGTYRIFMWGAGGGGAAGGGNGPRAGGGAGCVYKDVAYASATNVSFSVGTKGGYGNANSGGGYGGSPGGGNGGNAGGGIDWTGGGGGGYTSALSMVAAGGGGAGGDGGGIGGAGGAGNGAGGGAGGSGNAGSPGSSGGGGGGGSNVGNQPTGGPGNGGSNSGSYSGTYNASGATAANRYYSSTYSRYFGDGDTNGGVKIEKIAAQNVPVVSITSNIPSTFGSTAGGSAGFSISATDTANGDSSVLYQWYLSTNGGSSYSAISGATSSSLTRYNPFYYSDNSHKIYCRATVTNTAGTNYADSQICTLTVHRNYDCNGPTITGSVTISNSGNKPSTNGGGDEEWGSWSPGYDDICEIDGYTNTFSAGGRFCNWNMELELRITRSTNGTKRHWGNQSKSGNQNSSQNFQINANGGSWSPESEGTPTFRLMVVDSGTQCQNGNQDIGCNAGAVTLSYSYKRRQYYYESRP